MQIQVFDSLDNLPPDLVAGCSYPAQPDFFRTLDWYRCLYDTALKATLTPRVYLVRDEQSRPLLTLFCGVAPGDSALVGLSNFYSLGYGPVLLDPSRPAGPLLSDLMAFIAAERPRWTRIELRLLDNQDPARDDLETAMRDAGFSVHGFFQYENWYLPSAGIGFEDYYAARSSRLRNTVKRKEKKLAKAHDYRITIHTADDDALASAIDAYVSIYNSSWKVPEPFPDFTPTLIRTCARLGLLRLGVLYLGEQAAAAQLWINTPRKAIIYKLAYREEYAALSPGSILSREMFRHALDQDHVAEIDYGVGSEAYKKDWMSEMRELRGIRAYNMRTPAGAVAAVIERIKNMVRVLRGPAR